MSRPPAERTRAIVLDVEGTTTPIAFVHDVLFAFARARVDRYLAEAGGADEHQRILSRLRDEHAADAAAGFDPPPWEPGPGDAPAAADYVRWLIDQDRKSAALKELQGRIWERGYTTGELRGEVFPDVPPALERWREQGIEVRIFSSGSVLAQRLLFATTPAGDLTRLLSGYFDTAVGSKIAPESYRRIAAAMQAPAGEILFISDVIAELEAAAAAGLRTLLAIRPGNAPVPPDHPYTAIRSLAEVVTLQPASS